MAAYTTIDNPELYFQVKTYTGNGSTQSITLDGDTDMQPDLVWIKSRNDTNPHTVVDSVRGATKVHWTNVRSAEGTFTDEVTSFDSDGFSLGASSNAYTNENTITHGKEAFFYGNTKEDIQIAINHYKISNGLTNKVLSRKDKHDVIRFLIRGGHLNKRGAVAIIGEALSVTRPTVYKYIKEIKLIY